MRRLRLALMGIALVSLLCGAGGATLAQSEGMPEPAVSVTGSFASCELVDPGKKDILPGGMMSLRDYVDRCSARMSDPRVSGDYTGTWNEDCRLASDGTIRCLAFGTMVGEAGAGGWDCSVAGTDDPTGLNHMLLLIACAGAGEHEGLAFVAQQALAGGYGTAGDFGDGNAIHGLIYEGPLPPHWGPPPAVESSVVALAKHDMVTICSKPGTPAEKTMEVRTSKVQRHLEQGAYLGECVPAIDACTYLNDPALDSPYAGHGPAPLEFVGDEHAWWFATSDIPFTITVTVGEKSFTYPAWPLGGPESRDWYEGGYGYKAPFLRDCFKQGCFPFLGTGVMDVRWEASTSVVWDVDCFHFYSQDPKEPVG